MTDLYKWRGFQSSGGVLSPKGPIYELDSSNNPVTAVASTNPTVTKKWLLEAELYITNGATFYCKGGSSGDCDALRIRSTGSNDFYEVRARRAVPVCKHFPVARGRSTSAGKFVRHKLDLGCSNWTNGRQLACLNRRDAKYHGQRRFETTSQFRVS